MTKKQTIYLDYASTTPIDPVVQRYFGEKYSIFGNPGSTHSIGQEASRLIFESRRKLSDMLGVNYEEIIYTSGATEANNLALRGAVKKYSYQKKERPRVIVSDIEHESILETARDMEREGLIDLKIIPVKNDGVIDISQLKNLITKETAVVSIMYANNEIGTIEPVREISKLITGFRKKNDFPLFHTDAVQGFQFNPEILKECGADMITLSSHKIYGPKGIGALVVKKNNGKEIIKPILTGGGQEFGMRSGTENIIGILGFGKAAEISHKKSKSESARLSKLRNKLWAGIKKIEKKAEINGDLKKSLPNFLNVYIPFIKSEEMLIQLDRRGIISSAGSACSTRSMKPSHVLKAIGLPKEKAEKSIRFTLGRQTTESDIKKTLKALTDIKKVTN
ncbi:MAG: cysteine desulfurase NifS [Candidatus Harrisonbacteria bacterium CG10_big_fil_rev_8_21_14_0_10_40_38]|uniref:Cysteine desulfurase NifS n=1 Tax=Candidatus Harrisonbacteria bacterium CG10_big_fil_rev_8_21_14_0_10_40_38 TaxID=1974583 RepID=A0A2H0UR94_9BACT|nr:MAG: cysteine desulfurase NifS [Candidatus Harrisonbacteria bacterium CG10_big_fil_rev_8_21_14_0_10_40_38]